MQSVCTGHGDDGITGGHALQRIIHSGTHKLHVSAPEIVGFFANALLKKECCDISGGNHFIGRKSFSVLPTHITKFRDYGISQSLIKSMLLLPVWARHYFLPARYCKTHLLTVTVKNTGPAENERYRVGDNRTL